MAGDPSGDVDVLVDAGCVLLLDDTDDGVEGHYCESSLSVGAAADRAELLVSFPSDETRRVGFGGDVGARQPAKRGRILVGNTMETATVDDPDLSDPIVIDVVRDPKNLRELGTKVSRFCEAWSQAGYRLSICFDSLTDLLDHADPETAFRFTHALCKRLEAVDAVVHFHVDPDAHPDHLVGTFEQLFDEVVVEFEAALDVEGGYSRASDSDVAESTETADTGPSESEGPTESGASDDDIAKALRD